MRRAVLSPTRPDLDELANRTRAGKDAGGHAEGGLLPGWQVGQAEGGLQAGARLLGDLELHRDGADIAKDDAAFGQRPHPQRADILGCRLDHRK
ncbi:hypothetical protein J4558_10265 [Leptolyngbya sp. 15MV]|nr:hypothetical protein J4558_10265 [Leptolyngbya sp. 15MV]